MNIMQVHNYYQKPGGEDQVFTAEGALLEAHGHHVHRYTVHNRSVALQSKLSLGVKAVWNQRRYQKVYRILQRLQPQVVHVHNTLPLISPAIYYAAQAAGIPVCQTLHNYRLLCPNALLFRNDRVCENCLDRLLAWPGIIHACYQKSRLATIVVALVNFLHRLIGTWKNKIDVFVTLNEFSKKIFIRAGLPKNKILVKPNFVECIPSMSGSKNCNVRDGALFVGRLSKEKGVETLLKAWQIIGETVPLKIAGDGPLAHYVHKISSDKNFISWHGQKSSQEVFDMMGKSKILVFPSECYECMPRTIIESFAHCTPVIASNLGSMTELISNGKNGLYFDPGNFLDLSQKVLWANAHPDKITRMGRHARIEYEANYTPMMNYTMLMGIYEQTIENHAKKQSRVNKKWHRHISRNTINMISDI